VFISGDIQKFENSCRSRIGSHFCDEPHHTGQLADLPVSSGILIDEVDSHRKLTRSIGQASHIRLSPEESDTTQRKLQAARGTWRDPAEDSVLPEEISQPSGLVEGAVRSIMVNAYERNPKARRECIHAHGTACCICGFTFGAVYGKVAEDYIHIHHIRPLSEVNGEYIVDPVKDLRPVCPNCHAVLHMRGECRGIEDVKSLMEDNQD